MSRKLQIVFCRHTYGQLATADRALPQPPLGALALASYASSRLPDLTVEVIDGRFFGDEELARILDGDIVGFSVWFSNYPSSIALASRVKEVRPRTQVIMGGPYATWMGLRILRNRPCVDFVVQGEGELPLVDLLVGKPPAAIPGLLSRGPAGVSGSARLSPSHLPTLHSLPSLRLDLLHPPFRWRGASDSIPSSAFPLSGIRGCEHGQSRCEYCSIPTIGYRTTSAAQYWEQIQKLRQRHGIDFFFETGDTFSTAFARELAAERDRSNVAFKVYRRPGTSSTAELRDLSHIGVKAVFMGIESILHWTSASSRRYSSSYSVLSLRNEISRYHDWGITVWPAFLLGLPGETRASLIENVTLIEHVAGLPNVAELTISIVMPLPGSRFFSDCCSDATILAAYASATGSDLLEADVLDDDLLKTLFVDCYAPVGFPRAADAVAYLKRTLGPQVATWSLPESVHHRTDVCSQHRPGEPAAVGG